MKGASRYTPQSVSTDRYEWWTAVRAAEYLGIGQVTIRKMIHSGSLKAVSYGTTGKHYRTTQRWCDEYVQSVEAHVEHEIPKKPIAGTTPYMLPVVSSLVTSAESILDRVEHEAQKRRERRAKKSARRSYR